MPITKVLPCGSLKVMPSKIGRHLGHYCGSTENVLFSPSAPSPSLTFFYLHSRFRQECTQARLFRPKFIMTLIIDHPTARRSSRISNPSVMQDPLILPSFSSTSRTRESRMPTPYFPLSSFNSAINPHLSATFSLDTIHPTNLVHNNPVTEHSYNASK
jgi:hypothetical protein